MSVDPRTPVVAGAATLTQRPHEGTHGALPAPELMIAAVDAAASAGGCRSLLPRTSVVAVPHGSWTYPNPAGQVASHIGAKQAKTIQSELGVLQQSLVTRAAEAVASGAAEVVVVCGGEDRHSARRAPRAHTGNGGGPDPGPPDEILVPDREIISALEVERELAVPARQYAIIEDALRRASGSTQAENALEVARLWESFAEVAAARDDSWDQSKPSTDRIVSAGASNRMIATPYTKLMCSQWNVDQAAALIFTSAEAALDAGAPLDGLVFPVSAVESNHVVPLAQRELPGRWPAFAGCASEALALAGWTIDDLELIDLYSCFPAAVKVQAHELGLSVSPRSPAYRALTLTGGMTFGGGPLNNYVLQSSAAMVQALKGRSRGTGMLTSVSGMLSKPAVATWSSEPPAGGFRSSDTSGAVRSRDRSLPLMPGFVGPATIVGSTVVYDAGAPAFAAAVLDVDGGARTVAISDDAATAAALLQHSQTSVDVYQAGRFRA